MQIYMLAALIFSVIIAIFAVQNTQTVTITFFFFQTQGVSLSIVILLSAAIGALLTFVLGLWRMVRTSLGQKNDKKKIQEQERTIQDLLQTNARAQENLKQLQKDNEQLKSNSMSSPMIQPTANASAATAPIQTQGTSNANSIEAKPSPGPSK